MWRGSPSLHSFVKGETHLAELEDQILQRDEILKIIHSNLTKAQAA